MFRLHDMGILGEKTICGHCIYINEADIDLLRSTAVSYTHLDLYKRQEYPPLADQPSAFQIQFLKPDGALLAGAVSYTHLA